MRYTRSNPANKIAVRVIRSAQQVSDFSFASHTEELVVVF